MEEKNEKYMAPALLLTIWSGQTSLYKTIDLEKLLLY